MQRRECVIDVGAGQRDHMAEPVQHCRNIARIFARHHHAVILFILGQNLAVAIMDHPARGRHEPDRDPVFFGQKAELVGLFDAKIAHARPKGGKHCRHAAGEQKRASGDAAGAGLIVARNAFHSRLPYASTSPMAGLYRCKTMRERKTTRG